MIVPENKGALSCSSLLLARTWGYVEPLSPSLSRCVSLPFVPQKWKGCIRMRPRCSNMLNNLVRTEEKQYLLLSELLWKHVCIIVDELNSWSNYSLKIISSLRKQKCVDLQCPFYTWKSFESLFLNVWTVFWRIQWGAFVALNLYSWR